MANYKVALSATSKAHSEHKILRRAIKSMHEIIFRSGKMYKIYQWSPLNKKWIKI